MSKFKRKNSTVSKNGDPGNTHVGEKGGDVILLEIKNRAKVLHLLVMEIFSEKYLK